MSTLMIYNEELGQGMNNFSLGDKNIIKVDGRKEMRL